jgi:hypothetical protein
MKSSLCNFLQPSHMSSLLVPDILNCLFSNTLTHVLKNISKNTLQTFGNFIFNGNISGDLLLLDYY